MNDLYDDIRTNKHLLYFGDPMCSWCWGFSPVLRRLVDVCADKALLHVVMTGLRPGTTEPWDADMRTFIHQHWVNVGDQTGQPFNFERFENTDFIYDTEPACRAVVSARTLAPETALPVFEAIQKAFYADGQDVNNLDQLADIAAVSGVDRTQFKDLMQRPTVLQQTRDDFTQTRNFGVLGYPTVLLAQDGKVTALTQGYQSFESLAPLLEEWLNA
ncbi:MAG: DsbA family protein [Magnetovibrio sp.]|nr:DsbA family protein [Magnetovibrio sp.]